MRVDSSCAVCASNNFSLDEAEADSSKIVCRDCGHDVGSYGHVKALLLAELRRPRAQRSGIVLMGAE